MFVIYIHVRAIHSRLEQMSMSNRINKLFCIYTMKYYTVMESNKRILQWPYDLPIEDLRTICQH